MSLLRFTSSTARLFPRRLYSSASLGLRSTLPPDSTSPPPPSPSSPPPPPISDAEWELRTGRAIFILQQTLPTFFSTGLLTSLEHDQEDSIYSPKIRLSYTPPTPLPAPFPKTFHVESLPLYMASSAFIRHTLNALYADIHVELKRTTVQTPGTLPHGTAEPGGAANEGAELQSPGKEAVTHRSREKSVFVGLNVTGAARVSGAKGQWEVNSTYTFSPLTGQIQTHIVNSIHPAPHQAVYHTLRASLAKVLGGGNGGGGETTGAPTPTACGDAGAGMGGKGK